MVLPQLIAGLDEQFRGDGVELEHLEVVGNGDLGANVPGQLSGFLAIEVTGDTAFGFVAVDGEKGDADARWNSASTAAYSICSLVRGRLLQSEHCSALSMRMPSSRRQAAARPWPPATL